MAEKVLIYYNAGDDFAGTFDNTNSEKREWKNWAKENNQIGYISGYRYFDGKCDSVMVFCQEKPSFSDIEKRRSNGLRNAKWNYIK